MENKGQKRGVSPDNMGGANVAGANAPPVKTTYILSINAAAATRLPHTTIHGPRRGVTFVEKQVHVPHAASERPNICFA